MIKGKNVAYLLFKSFGKTGLSYLLIILIISIFIALLSSYAPILLASIISDLKFFTKGEHSASIIGKIIALAAIIGLSRLVSPVVTFLNAMIRTQTFGYVTDTYFDYYGKNSDDESLYKTPARVASHINQVNNELYIIYNYLTSQILVPVCQLLFSTIILLFLKQYLFLVFIYFYIITYIFIQIHLSKFITKYKMALMDSGRSVYTLLEDFLNNISVAVRFKTINLISNAFKAKLKTDLDVQRPYFKFYIILNSINYILCFVIGNIVLIYCYSEVIFGQNGVDYFIMMNGYLMMLIMPIEQIGGVYTALRQSFSAIDYFINEVRYDAPDARGNVKLTSIDTIRFENFSYAYKGADSLIFNNMSLTINKGDKIALIGKSGIGKSTFSKILYDLDVKNRGTLFLSNVDALDLSAIDLRGKICVITQNSYIFNESCYFNLQIANASASHAQMEEALKTVGLYDELCALPNSLNTPLGHHGNILSGGQKQRLCVARLFLTNPDIIILDEVSSGLDKYSEKLVYDRIYKIFAEKIIISISHREQLLAYSHKIVELIDGKLIERK